MDTKDTKIPESIYSSFLTGETKNEAQKEGFFNLSTGKQEKLKPKVQKKSVGENKYNTMKLAKPTNSGFRKFKNNLSDFTYTLTSPFRRLVSFAHSGASRKQFIMLVPENTGKTVSLPITNILMFVVFSTITVIACFGTISYKSVSDERQFLSELNRDNRDMARDIRKYSAAINNLRTKIATYQSHLTELATLVSYDSYDSSNISDSHSGSAYVENLDSISKSAVQIGKSLNAVNSFYDKREFYRSMIPVGWPVANGGHITSGYGERSNPFTMKTSFHAGIDIAHAHGTPILSVADGVVVFSGWRNAYGWFVIIEHQNGYQTAYGHNSVNLVVAGERVRKGSIIAEMGKTGRVTGVHSHFEVRINDNIVQPFEYITTRF